MRVALALSPFLASLFVLQACAPTQRSADGTCGPSASIVPATLHGSIGVPVMADVGGSCRVLIRNEAGDVKSSDEVEPDLGVSGCVVVQAGPFDEPGTVDVTCGGDRGTAGYAHRRVVLRSAPTSLKLGWGQQPTRWSREGRGIGGCTIGVDGFRPRRIAPDELAGEGFFNIAQPGQSTAPLTYTVVLACSAPDLPYPDPEPATLRATATSVPIDAVEDLQVITGQSFELSQLPAVDGVITLPALRYAYVLDAPMEGTFQGFIAPQLEEVYRLDLTHVEGDIRVPSLRVVGDRLLINHPVDLYALEKGGVVLGNDSLPDDPNVSVTLPALREGQIAVHGGVAFVSAANVLVGSLDWAGGGDRELWFGQANHVDLRIVGRAPAGLFNVNALASLEWNSEATFSGVFTALKLQPFGHTWSKLRLVDVAATAVEFPDAENLELINVSGLTSWTGRATNAYLLGLPDLVEADLAGDLGVLNVGAEALTRLGLHSDENTSVGSLSCITQALERIDGETERIGVVEINGPTGDALSIAQGLTEIGDLTLSSADTLKRLYVEPLVVRRLDIDGAPLLEELHVEGVRVMESLRIHRAALTCADLRTAICALASPLPAELEVTESGVFPNVEPSCEGISAPCQ